MLRHFYEGDHVCLVEDIRLEDPEAHLRQANGSKQRR